MEATMKLTKDKRAKLRQVAEGAKRAAGGGTWTRWNGNAQVGILNRFGAVNTPGEFHGDTFIEVEHSDDDFNRNPKSRAIARFIAAADPNTLLALLDALDAAEASA
jgi:hypothetical protein